MYAMQYASLIGKYCDFKCEPTRQHPDGIGMSGVVVRVENVELASNDPGVKIMLDYGYGVEIYEFNEHLWSVVVVLKQEYL